VSTAGTRERSVGFFRMRLRPVALAVCALVLVWLAAPMRAAAANLPAEGSELTAAGFTTGPVITEAGLVWEGSEGVMLTHPNDTTSVLAPNTTPNWDNSIDQAWFGSAWWVLASGQGVVGGPIGGPLRGLPVLAHCNPDTKIVPLDSADEADPPLYAVSGENLFAALPRSCAPGRRVAPGTLVRVDLRTGRARTLARLPAPAGSLAAAGGYVVVAFKRTAPVLGGEMETPLPERVSLYNSRTGTLVRRINPPAEEEGAALQLDAEGDVLAGCCEASSGALAHTAQLARIERYWWAPAGTTAGVKIQLGGDPALSDGRIAYIDGDAIELTEPHDGQTRAVVTFSGTDHPQSIALSANELAWEQLGYSLVTMPGACQSVVLTPPQLASLDLRGAPIAVAGPAPAQPQCFDESPAPP
jgi:hypothetical protein